MGEIDREKHDIDIVERVLAQQRESDRHPSERVQVIDVRIRPGVVTSTPSAAEMIVGRSAPPDNRDE